MPRFLTPGTDIMQKVAGSKGFREFLGRQFDKLVGDVEMFMDAPPLASVGIVGAMTKAGIRGVGKGVGIAKEQTSIKRAVRWAGDFFGIKKPKTKQIPQPLFRKAEDAKKYGAMIKERPGAIAQLKKSHKTSLARSAALEEAGAGFYIRQEEAIKGELFREALKEATGKPPYLVRTAVEKAIGEEGISVTAGRIRSQMETPKFLSMKIVPPVMRSVEEAEKYGRSIREGLNKDFVRAGLKKLYKQNVANLAQMKALGASRQVQEECALRGQNLRVVLKAAGEKFPGGKEIQLMKLLAAPVPVFKSTEDAIKYGRSVIKNPIAQKQLKTLHKLSLEKSGTLKKAGAGFDIRMEEALKGQFFREALEEVSGRFPHIGK